ncbi:uncharacterized protein LOC134255412 [Saccostrea cucullata]|uniref:uncharacterized protein LOC134237963 n=1 Tax=Saccostrea cuccullata TaxID=36930 RepID=UPI002ED4971B
MRRKLEALKTEPLGSKGKPRTSVSTRMAPTELLQRQQRQARQPSLLLVLPLLLHLRHIHISSSPFVANSQGVNHSPATYASTVFPLVTGKPTAPKTSHKVNDKYTVPDRRIDDAICCLQKTIIHFPDVTARELARVVGKIISMTPVMDIFKVGRWTGINCGLQDHRLAELASELPRYCVTSKAENTAKQYRSLSFCKKFQTYKLRSDNRPISYTRAREIILDSLEKIGLDKCKFGVHSLRSGGATSAAAAGVSDRLFKKHGRWRSENSKDGYVKENQIEKLSVTKNLGI